MTGLEIVEGLGSTEVLHVYLSNTVEKKKPGAAGLRVPGYELALKDQDGKDVADGERGYFMGARAIPIPRSIGTGPTRPPKA